MPRTSAIPVVLPDRRRKIAAEVAIGPIAVVATRPAQDHLSPRIPGEGTAIDTAARLEDMGVPEAEIRLQLGCMLRSKAFSQSERLSRFLRFIVEHAVTGNQSYLKEYVIGSEVYDRKPPYHPSQDSIVRTEARRLRGKLKEYYETEGNQDSVYIYLRPGNYKPVFQRKESLAGSETAADAGYRIQLTKSSAVAIAILPFNDISRSSLSSTFSRGIPDELAYALMRIDGCRVISPAAMAHHGAQEHDIAAAMGKAGAQIAFEGSVREEGNRIRVTARIVDASGFQLWAKRFDTETSSQPLFAIEEQIAFALSGGVEMLIAESQRRNPTEDKRETGSVRIFRKS